MTGQIICTAFGKGTVHDFRLFKLERLPMLPDQLCLADKGYQGLAKLHPNNLSSMRHSLIIKPSLKLYLSNKYQLLKWEISHFIINNQNLLTMKWESSGDC